jgi:hypothetical protein
VAQYVRAIPIFAATYLLPQRHPHPLLLLLSLLQFEGCEDAVKLKKKEKDTFSPPLLHLLLLSLLRFEGG